MPKRARDYKAEYAARKQRAATRGYTTAQARGHARPHKDELPISLINTVKAGHESPLFQALPFHDKEQIIDKLAPHFPGKRKHEIWSQLLGSP